MSKNAGKSEMSQSNDIMQANIARLEAIGIPTIEAQRIALQSPELVGLLEAEQLGPSAMEGLQEDPRLAGSKMSALEGITGLAQTGLGAEDKAAFNDLRRQAAAQAQAQQASSMQEMAARGTLDSGASLAAQLQAGQGAADRMSQEGDRLAGHAATARRAALGQQADMASSMSAQNLGMQEKKLSAADAIASFNAQNKQNVNAQNLGARQNIANQKTANINQAEIYNKGLVQQQFQNEFQKAGGVSGATTAAATNIANQGQAKAQGQADQFNAILGAGAKVAAA